MTSASRDSQTSRLLQQQQHHSAIVLFYKYFLPSEFPILHRSPRYYEEKLVETSKQICLELGLKGRLLLAAEGVNGTLSASSAALLEEFKTRMEELELIRDLGVPESLSPTERCNPEYLFRDIDWKLSSNRNDADGGILEPFPDLKVTIVKEIISSGGIVPVQEMAELGGHHLTPTEFHQTLVDNPQAVLIDVRNTFEYSIGHFIHPATQAAAMNPEMVTFSSFDSVFCSKQAEDLKDKKVLMYCTGGIRCEKASVMLKRRGVKDVSQLSGGIHRYLETFGDRGFFQGQNFVFDQRVALKPKDCLLDNAATLPRSSTETCDSVDTTVGRCIECNSTYDEICGSRLCTVCRDLVLVCPTCQTRLREYHCRRHKDWKTCYFTFLEVYTASQLEKQRTELEALRDTYLPADKHKNVRRTLSRQIEKVTRRLDAIETGLAVVNVAAPRRCRTCMESSTVCDGRCWGFWKTQQRQETSASKEESESSPLPVDVGDAVEPGPDWNELRLGSPFTTAGVDGIKLKSGHVVEVKSWGAGGIESDCVAVQWQGCEGEAQIYRWGVRALNGKRMYDLRKCSCDSQG